MLIVLAASLSGVLLIASSESLPPISLIVILGVIGLIFLGGIRFLYSWLGCSLGLKAVAKFLIAFLLSYSWAALCGFTYLNADAQDGDWLIEVVNEPKVSYGKVSFKSRLICRIENDDQKTCDQIRSHPLGLPSYGILSVPTKHYQRFARYLLPGQTLKVDLVFSKKEFRGNPGFDRDKWFLSERIVAAAEVQQVRVDSATPIESVNFYRYWLKQRLRFSSSIEQSSFNGLPLEPLIMALTLGDRSNMSAQHWGLLRETGTTHLMAISGLHLGLLSGWVFWFVSSMLGLIRGANQRYYPQTIAGVSAITVAAIYGALVGFPLPTQRAFIMLCFACLCIMVGRPKLIVSALVVALLMILFIQPFAVLSASLWLSFFAISLVFYVIANRMNTLTSTGGSISLGLQVQLCFFVVMAPLAFYFFGGASTNSFISNLLAIPVVTAVLLPLGVVNAVVAGLHPESVPMLGEFIYWVLDCLLSCLAWINEGSPEFVFRRVSTIIVVLAMLGGLLVFSPLEKWSKVVGFSLLGLLFLPAEPETLNRVELYNTQSPFMVFSSDHHAPLIVDETPGQRWREQSVLEKQLPGYQKKITSHFQQLWRYEHWVMETGNNSLGFCQRSLSMSELETMDGEFTDIQVFPLNEGSDNCLVYLEWQKNGWLLVGSINKLQQQALLDTESLALFLDGIPNVDFVLMGGDYFVGAFLSAFEGATAVVWNKGPLDAQMAQRFGLRGITLIELAKRGATSIRLDEEGYRSSAMVSRRFYHSMLE